MNIHFILPYNILLIFLPFFSFSHRLAPLSADAVHLKMRLAYIVHTCDVIYRRQ